MRYWYDFEFTEAGNDAPIVPLALGMVDESDRTYYRQYLEGINVAKGNPWIRENVFPGMKHMIWDESKQHMTLCFCWAPTLGKQTQFIYGTHPDWIRSECPWISLRQASLDLLLFMDVARYGKPELWAYYADYDHVCYAQLFGAMIALPPGMPMYTLDIKQEAKMRSVRTGEPEIQFPQQTKGSEHNALNDAQWNRDFWRALFPGGLPEVSKIEGSTSHLPAGLK